MNKLDQSNESSPLGLILRHQLQARGGGQQIIPRVSQLFCHLFARQWFGHRWNSTTFLTRLTPDLLNGERWRHVDRIDAGRPPELLSECVDEDVVDVGFEFVDGVDRFVVEAPDTNFVAEGLACLHLDR